MFKLLRYLKHHTSQLFTAGHLHKEKALPLILWKYMVAACGESNSNTPCLKNPHTNTKKFSFTSDMSLVLPNLWLKSVRRVLKRTAIFVISSLYLARTMLGSAACAKNSSSVVVGKAVCYKCPVCGAATPTTKNAIIKRINELYYYDHLITCISNTSWAVFGSWFHISACHCSFSRLKLTCFK